MAEEVIGLLFGVKGGGDINGASGKQIVSDLTDIVNAINADKSRIPAIKFNFDTTEASKAVDDLKNKLKDIEKIATIKVTYHNGGGNGGKGGKGGKSLSQELQAEMAKIISLHKQLDAMNVKIAKNQASNGDPKLLSAYVNEATRLEKLYADSYQSFIQKVSANPSVDTTAFQAQIQSLNQIATATVEAVRAKKVDADTTEAQKKKYEELSAAIQKWTKDSTTAAKLSAEYSGVSRDEHTGQLTANAGAAPGYQETIESINQTVQAVSKLKFEYATLADVQAGLAKNVGDLKLPDQGKIDAIASSLGITTEQYKALFAEMQAGSAKATQATENANRKNTQQWIDYASKVRDEIRRNRDVISKDPSVKKLADEIMKYSQSATGSVGDLKNKYDELRNAIHKSGADVETWGDKFKKTFAGKVRSALAGAITAAITKYLREIYQNVVKLDQSLVNLQIASGKTREETRALIKEYASLAKQLGATTTEVAAAADTWLRQGYTTEEATNLIRNSTMLSKLGQMEAAEASKALTSAMKGYKVEVNDSIKIVDKFTAVDMEAAASAGDIATAMAETATSANIAGVSMDKLIGYITTVKEVTQDASESVGTFYKTLFARMNNVAAGKFVDDETGEALNDVETVLNKLDISLKNVNGTFRNSSEVLDEVASRWQSFDNVSQHAIATAFAGTRQQEKFIVLMENYGKALDYTRVAAESAGTANEKYSAWLDGVEGKLNTLKASFEALSMAVMSSELVATGIEMLTGILDTLNAIASVGDGVIITAAAITTAILLLNAAFNAVKKRVTSLIREYAELAGVQATGTITTKMFSAALLQFSSTGLLGVITTIPRLIAAIVKYIIAAKSGTGATLTFKGALDLLKVNPWIALIEGIIIVIGLAVAGINKMANAAAEASAKAKEHAQSMQEAADKAREEQDALDELITKYEELKSKGSINADTRKEIRDIQKQINQLVSSEVSEWDMVNGSLDDTLKKLRQIRAQKAGDNLENYQQAYSAAQTSSNLAYESDVSGAGWAEWFANSAGLDLVIDGWDEQAAEILNRVEGVSSQWDSNIVSAVTDVSFEAEGAEEYVARITAAMNALEDDMNYDHLHSKVYQQLSSLKSAYEAYTLKTTEAADQLLEGVITFSGATLEANGVVIESLEDYEAFKQAMIDAAMSSEHLKDALASQAVTQQTVTEAANDYMATNYADLYDKFAASVASSNSRLKTFLEILEEVQNGFDILSQSLSDMDEYGYLSAGTLSKLLDPENGYPALAKYLTMTANGYTISADALKQYIKEQQDAYVLALATAEEGSEAYNIAYQNLERFIAVSATLQLTREIEREKKALEDRKGVWEDQLVKYKELIDVRKELLNTYSEELEYQKELEKKQRNVANLQTKLSIARLDTSAAGQARVRELEAELQKAQEELDDFTLEHAIDLLTSQLDNQSKEYENFIETKVAEITAAINGVAGAVSGVSANFAEKIKQLIDEYKKEHPEVSGPPPGGSPPGNGQGGTAAPLPPVQMPQLPTNPTKRPGLQGTGIDFGGIVLSKADYNSKIRKDANGNTYIDLHVIRPSNYPDENWWAKLGEGYTAKEAGNNYEIDIHSFKPAYKFHQGGIVGDASPLYNTEVFAKLLKGEFVSTPAQMKRFMEETLPKIAHYTTSGGTTEFNAPLVEIVCESVTTESMPELKRVVNEAVQEIKRELDSGMSRTGFKRTKSKRLV